MLKSKLDSVKIDDISKKKFNSIIESSDDSIQTKNFKKLLNLYLENLTKFQDKHTPEFEIRFGTKKIKIITKNDMYNVIKSLLNSNFKLNSENYFMKIIPDNLSSNIRTQISGFPNIQHYCKNNSLVNIEDKTNLEFIEKEYFNNKGSKILPLDFDEFNFRVAFQVEKYYNMNDPIIQDYIAKWKTTKKIFRYIKRYEYTHPSLPFLIHCSIVKTSSSKDGKFIPQFNISDSDVFNSIEHYEIEIELNNLLIETGYDSSRLYSDLRLVIKYILIGLQQSNFPIQYTEQESVGKNYLKLIKNKEFDESKKINVKDFIGPSSVTLQMINILNDYDINDTNKSIPNIRNNYTVTDKADGLRKLLFINEIGRLYFITSSMNIEFTGCIVENNELFNTIIDGEHILNDKNGEYINLYAAFDIYYINSKNITGFAFINTPEKETKKEKEEESKKNKDELQNFRLSYLNTVIKKIKLKSIIPNVKPSLNLMVKKFYANNIFKACDTILNNLNSGLYEYNTDGLIFTPANTGVSSNKTGYLAPNYKNTWNESFKWKPPEYNTIDFLIKFKKDDYGANQISNIYTDGISLTTNSQIQKYYTLLLHVGFDEKRHGYINPFNDLINDKITKKEDQQYIDNYKPALFYPTNPSDNTTHLCNVLGKLDSSNTLKIYTEEGEEIEDNTIVEFKYDSSKDNLWKWIPIRVRSDKTAELRSGIKNFGNAYHVANTNWQSIHNPITQKIISSGEYIKLDNSDDDVYYNKIENNSETRPLRDFHNLYIKNLLIDKISNPGFSLIDFACGKGGDLPKWINAQLSFVLGIDLNRDNILNRLDGACARYLNYAKKYSNLPKALFINGNSSVNIKNGDAFTNDKNKQIVKAVFGEGQKNEIILGKGVYKNYGIASNGFNISSIQFALHYMFENKIILNEFIKNVSQCTSIDGYFVGTCYNGKKVFNMLNDVETDNSISLFKNGKKIWEVYKRYSSDVYNDDDSCIGYAIDVYQESINKIFREYLVNFDYFTRIMENYGFVLLTDDEVKGLKLPGTIGGFDELYNSLTFDIKNDKRVQNKIGNALEMSNEEKQISFLNNYFIYKKIRNISEKDEQIYEKELLPENVIEEFSEINKLVDDIDKTDISERSKKLAEKYIQEIKDDSSTKIQQDESEDIKSKPKIKFTKESIKEKLELAEKKKKEKEELKKREKEEKAALKLKEKQEKADSKIKK